MAIAQSDGSIILTTKVDTTGINKGVSNIKGAVSSASKIFAAFGSVITASLGVTAFMNFSREAGEMATQQEANIQRLIDIYGEASKTLGDFIDTNARALGMSKSAAASFSAVYGNLFSVWADQNTNATLTEKYLNMTAVVASKSGRTVQDVQERVRSGLLGNTEAIEDLGIFVNVKTIEMTKAFQRMADGRSWEQLGVYEQQQIRTLAILEQATQKYGNEVADTTALTRAKFQAAYEDFQATWGQFVNKVLMPVLEVATQVMNVLTIGLQTIAGLTGKTIDNTKNISSSIGSSVDNQNALTDAVKETNKELKKSVASFDTIETLSSQTTSDSEKINGSASGGLGNIFGEDMTVSSKAQDTVNEALHGVMAVAGMSLAAIGMILIATGHLAWGVAFLIAGIAIFAISAATLNSDAVSEETKKALAGAIVVAGVVAVILGLLVCLTGHWGIGLGLIIMGVVSIVTAVSLDWNAVKNALKGPMGTALAIVGIVAIVLGILLCFAQHWGIGIGLIVTGALSVGTAVALNWNAIKDKLQGTLGTVLVVAGIVAVVLGILLCVAQRWAIGIGLILTGAVAIGISVAINWDSIKEKTANAMTKVGDWLKSWGLLVLGVLLCFTGVGIPLGIALIKKGAENLAKSENPKWQTVGEKIQETINSIKNWLESWGLLVLGVLLCLTGIGIPLGLPLIKKGAENLAKSENPNWQITGNNIQKTINNIGDWLKSWGLLVLGVLLCITAVGMPLGIALIKKGAENLAKSENPDWQKTGNTIQSTIDNIGKWLKTWGLLVLGVILCFTGVGIPLGMGLIKKGAENLAQEKDPLWNSMLDRIKETWAKIKEYWRNNIAKYFTADWWGSLARNAVNGLLRWFINGINKLIDKLNSFGFTLPDVLGGGRVGFNISKLKIPQLAKGAVLPANHPFLAVVGDQKHGTNIEAPADLIKQMAMEAIIEAGGMGGGQTVREEHYYLDETELMSIIYRLVKGGERLNGDSLVTGGAY